MSTDAFPYSRRRHLRWHLITLLTALPHTLHRHRLAFLHSLGSRKCPLDSSNSLLTASKGNRQDLSLAKFQMGKRRQTGLPLPVQPRVTLR